MPQSLLRRALPFLGIAILVGILYDGYIFYSRWSANQTAVRQREEKDLDHARAVTALVGGDQLKILTFAASRHSVPRGTPVNLCYGTNAAKNVRIEPPVGDVYPALTKCLEVKPLKSTEYTLTAEDGAGHSTTATVAIHVR